MLRRLRASGARSGTGWSRSTRFPRRVGALGRRRRAGGGQQRAGGRAVAPRVPQPRSARAGGAAMSRHTSLELDLRPSVPAASLRVVAGLAAGLAVVLVGFDGWRSARSPGGLWDGVGSPQLAGWSIAAGLAAAAWLRSEERRVGKEGRAGCGPGECKEE